MSVRVNDRHISEIEYENTFSKLNSYISGKLMSVPKRYSYYLTHPFNKALNNTYVLIMEVTNAYISGNGTSSSRYAKCGEILKCMSDIISFSYTFWNLAGGKNGIKPVTAKQRAFWAGHINRETALVAGVMEKCRKRKGMETDIPKIRPYTEQDFRDVVFLQKLAKLERIVYKRAIQAGNGYRDARLELLVSLARDALFYACTGNMLFADNTKLKKQRISRFSNSIGALMSMNRPVRELAFDDVFPEEELEAICTLITDSQRILRAIRDNERKQCVTA